MASDGATLEVEFVEFCKALLAKEGYELSSAPSPVTTRDRSPDLTVKDSNGDTTYVEIKFYRSNKGLSRLTENGLRQLERTIKSQGSGKGILILSAPVRGHTIADVDVSVDIWDLDTLFKKCRPDQSLIRRLARIVRATRADSDPAGEADAIEPQLLEPLAADPAIGRRFASALQSCALGREGSAAFENACQSAIELLFAPEFGAWTKQHPVEGGFHRLDLIGRLTPKHDFWVSLARDFRTRYVVFEFKNYSDPITQDQIYTTERYLYPTALRGVAVVVARNGLAESARSAIKGSLRESGKLILYISGSELADMLVGFDAGDDPHNLLIDRLDAILTDVGR